MFKYWRRYEKNNFNKVLLFVLAISLLVSSSVLAGYPGVMNNPRVSGGAKFRSRSSLINTYTVGVVVGALVSGVGYAYSKLFQGDSPDVEINKRQDELLERFVGKKEVGKEESSSSYRKELKYYRGKDIKKLSQKYYRKSQGYFFEDDDRENGDDFRYVDDLVGSYDEDKILTYDGEDDFYGEDGQDAWKDWPAGMNIVEYSGGSGEGGSSSTDSGNSDSTESDDGAKESTEDGSDQEGSEQPAEESDKDFVNAILTKSFSEAKKDYEMAVALGKTSADVHGAMIFTAKHDGQFDQVEKAYKNGLDREETSSDFYVAYINAAGEKKKFNLVEEAFLCAHEEGKSNARVCAAYIYVTEINDHFERIKEVYEDASEKK